MPSLQGSTFWAVLLLHKRYRYLKTRATYTRTHCKLKIAPCVAPTSLSCGHSCMHSVNGAILQQRGRVSAWQFNSPPRSRHRQGEKWCPASYSCLLTLAGVSSAIATSSWRNTLPFAERVLQQPAPILIGTDCKRTLGIWKLERICFLHIAGRANTAFHVP